jgi:hypothetical protein
MLSRSDALLQQEKERLRRIILVLDPLPGASRSGRE